MNDHIQDVTRRFAAAGYHAVAPALFHRAGGGTADYGDFASVIPLFEGVTDDGILTDVDAALEHLHAAGFADGAIGIVGFCFGGRVDVPRRGSARPRRGGRLLRRRHRRQGALPFDPLIGEAPTLRTPWLGLFGDEDAGIPVEDVEALREALTAAPVATEIVRYPGAEHGFHCDVRDPLPRRGRPDAWRARSPGSTSTSRSPLYLSVGQHRGHAGLSDALRDPRTRGRADECRSGA